MGYEVIWVVGWQGFRCVLILSFPFIALTTVFSSCRCRSSLFDSTSISSGSPSVSFEWRGEILSKISFSPRPPSPVDTGSSVNIHHVRVASRSRYAGCLACPMAFFAGTQIFASLWSKARRYQRACIYGRRTLHDGEPRKPRPQL